MKTKITKKKILCNCPCPGPYCTSLTHPCNNTDEHYPQRDEAVREIERSFSKKIIKKIKKMLREVMWTDYGWSDVEDDLAKLLKILEK